MWGTGNKSESDGPSRERKFGDPLLCPNCGKEVNYINNGRCVNCSPELAKEVEEQQRAMRDSEERRRALYYALRSRVLTDEEMQTVESYDYRICVSMYTSFMPEDKNREFNEALLQQFKLRLAAERSAK